MDTRDLQRSRGLPLFRGINFSSLEVDADLGGMLGTAALAERRSQS